MRGVAFICLVLLSGLPYAQTRYPMVNGKVVACDGIFEDSNNGLVNGRYDHNENLIFTICVPGADYLSFQFDSFCTEKDVDFLKVFDGPDTTGRLLGGPYSGSVSIPLIKSNDSCVTFYFESDKSVSCYGWKAIWETTTLPLLNPRFLNPPAASCSTEVLRVRLDQKFHCDSITADNFEISGVWPQQVQQVIALNCDKNRQTDSFEIRLQPGLDKGGGYQLDFEAVKYDFCDSPWTLEAHVPFQLRDCPIDVDLSVRKDTLCEGECTLIDALITGGDSSSYQFQWNQGILRNYGPVGVCPMSTTTYSLRVSDANSLPGEDSLTIYVKKRPQAMSDSTLCQSNPAFDLQAKPEGGIWSGKGITNPGNGTYLAGQAGAGRDTLLYTLNGCADTSLFTIRAINAGPPNTVCPNTSAFTVWNFSPAGGSWSGNHIQTNGSFTPPDTGIFTVTYEWNGCTDTKEIRVRPVTVTPFDTVCLSKAVHKLDATPAGGIWSGPGLRNNWDGNFYPATAGTGDHLLIYRTGQCRDSIRMHVIAINAGNNLLACPEQDSFELRNFFPAGGSWKGRGINDSSSNWYNPAFSKAYPWVNDTLTYAVDGCTDTRIVYVRYTRVHDTYKAFCLEDDPLVLDWAGVRRTPGGGQWSGNGVSGSRFIPSQAGAGLHRLYYSANGCTDSTEMFVHPPSRIQTDTQFCITDPVFQLRNSEGNGYFEGAGIVDGSAGLFLATEAGVGTHFIRYYSVEGCMDSFQITVQPRPQIRLTPPQYGFCHKDTAYQIELEPAFGPLSTLSGPGVVSQSFNPAIAGEGAHWIGYTYGTPTCYSSDSVRLSVLPPIELDLEAEKDTLCEGEHTLIQTITAGGIKDDFNYLWEDGSTDASLFAAPKASRIYEAVLSDGCSDPDTARMAIIVEPSVEVRISVSEKQCFGSQGWAEIQPLQSGRHTTTWFSSPVVKGNRLNASVGVRYRFSVKNEQTGCTFDSSVLIPGFDQIRAYFITNPSDKLCLNNLRNTLNMINLSSGGTKGYWDMGDGSRYDYDPSVNPSHSYSPEQAEYRLLLYVENEGECSDSFERIICMTDSLISWVPNAFSPDDDGVNDEFLPTMIGISEYELSIYNRWGELLFRTEDALKSWDGKANGRDCPAGTYYYTIRYKGKKTVNKMDSGTLLLLR